MDIGHDLFMEQALQLAHQGWPAVAPNPMVGCVIVKNDQVVATGYHQQFGDAHAEVVAINNLPSSISPLDCVLYVTLEPCSHVGKTPPCSDLVISKGFKTVVVACKDPNPLVSGKGVAKLQEAGITVIVGPCQEKARELNKRFITFFEKKRPYYVMKWAQTADGFISKLPVPVNQSDNKISGPEARLMVHNLRAEVMGIMVGKNTVLNDNPHLTTRLVNGKNPTRMFIDSKLEVPSTFNIYNSEANTIIFNRMKEGEDVANRFVKIDFSTNVLQQVSEKLYEFKIQSVLVEGGSFLLNDFIDQHLWDEALVFQNPNLNFSSGIKAPVFALKNSFQLVGNDKLYHHFNAPIA